MNKKKRALALGLAATQLSALTAMVAPLTAVADTPVATTRAAADPYTVEVTGDDGAPVEVTNNTFEIAESADATTTAVTYTITITLKPGYVFGASPSFTESDGSTVITKTNLTGTAFTGTVSLSPNANGDGAKTISIVPAEGSVLQTVTPTIAKKTDDTVVNCPGVLYSDSGAGAAAVAAANAAALYTVTTTENVELKYTDDYTLTCNYVPGSREADAKVTVTLALAAGQKKYAMADPAPNTLTVDIPVKFKAPPTVVVPSLSADGEALEDAVNTVRDGEANIVTKARRTLPTNDAELAKLIKFDKTVEGLIGGTDYKVAVGAGTVVLNGATGTDITGVKFTLTVSIETQKGKDAINFGDDGSGNPVYSMPVDITIPAEVVETYAFDTSSVDSTKATVTIKDAGGNDITSGKAAVDDVVTISIAAKPNYEVKSATIGSETIDLTNGLEYTIKLADVTGTSPSKKIKLNITAVIATKGTAALKAAASVTLTGTTVEDTKLAADDATAVLNAVKDNIKITPDAGGADVDLTYENDFTLAIKYAKGTSPIKVTVTPVISSAYSFNEVDVDVIVDSYKKIELVAPSVIADNANTPLSIPKNADAATIKDLLMSQISLPTGFKEDLFAIVDPSSTLNASTATTGVAVDAIVTYTINTTANYAFKDPDGTDVTDSVATLKIKYKIAADEAIDVTPAITITNNPLVLAEVPSEENVTTTALGAAVKVTVATGKTAPTEETHYTLTTSFDSSTNKATVKFELTTAGKALYKLASGVTVTDTSVDVPVKQKITLPTISEKVMCAVDASNNTAATDKIKQAVTDAITSELGVTVAAKVTFGAVTNLTVNVPAQDQIATVAVTLSDPYVLDDAGSNQSGSIDVTYDVAASYAVTVDSSITDATVTVDKSPAVVGEKVTITISGITAGKVVETVTYKGASNAEATTITAAADGSYSFTMPNEAVTVSATFVEGTEEPDPADEPTTPDRPLGGGHSTGASSGGSSSGSTGSSGGTSSTIISDIGSSSKGDTVSAPYGTTVLLPTILDSAADKGVSLSVPVNSKYTWTIDAAELDSTKSSISLRVTDSTVSNTAVSKIEGAPITEKIAFTTQASKLGKAATLTVTTSSRSTAAKPQFANLYKVKSDGSLEFVDVVPVGTDGKAVLPIADAATYSVLVSDETKKAGDLNNDCKVDLTDLSAALKTFVNASKTITRKENFKLDYDNSGEVRLGDISALLRDFVNKKV